AYAAAAGDDAEPRRLADALRDRHQAAIEGVAADAAGAEAALAAVAAHLAEFQALCHAARGLGEASPRALGAIAALGERMNAPIVAAALGAAGLPAEVVDAAQVVVTDAVHQAAAPDMEATQARAEAVVAPLLARGVVPVVTGFIGATPAGVVT